MTTNIKSKQLQILFHDFELLSKTTLTQLQIVTKLIEDNAVHESLFNEIKANEVIIDRLEIKIREEVVFTIFQFNPIAADLRRIISYQDITINLERVGDMLLNIAQFLDETDLMQHSTNNIRTMLKQMLDEATKMLRDAILSFTNSETKLAYNVIENDDKVDGLFHQIRLSLQEMFSEKLLTKKDIKALINIDAIAHNLERIGDSATNIAESAIYLTDGKDIRHRNDR